MSKLIDLTGQRFGRLTVLERAKNDKLGRARWLCRCDCGKEKIVSGTNLRSGQTRSCGCLSKEMSVKNGLKSRIGERSLKHGDFGSKLYGVWAGMKRRCQNPNTTYYKDYGGRGIKVCNEWQNYEAFKEWALESGYKEGLTIERIDVNGNYCPNNCKWIPLSAQNANKRNTIYIKYKGKLFTIKETAQITGFKERTIKGRYERGWDSEKIFTEKIKK